MKVLYVPNEHGTNRQHGMRRAFADLIISGLIEEARIFSPLWRIRDGQSPKLVFRELIELIQSFSPDIVLMQHVGGTGLDRTFFRELRNAGNFAFIYHEADPYSRFRHPLPKEATLAGEFADVVFTVGSNKFRNNFLRTGSSDVRWLPSVFDPGRFGITSPPRDIDRRHEIVMIANKGTPRIPFRGHPGWSKRIKFVNLLERRFGDRFAIYGKGWNGPSSQGMIPYNQQRDVLRSSWINANWDHYAYENQYFSDRLPIALSEGSVSATTRHPGYESFFGADYGAFIFASESQTEVCDQIEHYLSSSTLEDRFKRSQSAFEFANEHLRQDDQLVSILNWSSQNVDPVRAKNAWNILTPEISEI